MLKKFLFCVSFAAVAALSSASVLAATEPTMHEVYQAAQAGRFIEAQDMMDQVLKAHPNSAKAHFAEAELLARQGKLNQARTELASAERLQPGLAFAKPQAVSSLKALIESPRAPVSPPVYSPVGQPVGLAGGSAPNRGWPWGLILGGVGLLAFIVWAMRFMQQQSSAPPSSYPAGFGHQGAAQPVGAGMMGGAGMPMASAGPGIGSGIMGGLATGAALGAGMVAGEALMHHFTDGGRSSAAALPVQTGLNDTLTDNWSSPANDMGGSDFGVSDNASWDAAGGSDDSWG